MLSLQWHFEIQSNTLSVTSYKVTLCHLASIYWEQCKWTPRGETGREDIGGERKVGISWQWWHSTVVHYVWLMLLQLHLISLCSYVLAVPATWRKVCIYCMTVHRDLLFYWQDIFFGQLLKVCATNYSLMVCYRCSDFQSYSGLSLTVCCLLWHFSPYVTTCDFDQFSTGLPKYFMPSLIYGYVYVFIALFCYVYWLFLCCYCALFGLWSVRYSVLYFQAGGHKKPPNLVCIVTESLMVNIRFVVLLVSSILKQDIGWEEHLRSDTFLC